MLEAFLEIGLADVVDILLVTVLVYAAIVLIRRTQAAFVAIGILILGALYIAARALDLRLTAWLFQGFFAVFLVIIVVIFQEELRQLFERIAVWSLRRRAVPPSQSEAADILVKGSVECARGRIGALIVLPGLQRLQRHLQGGIELDGALSVPLLRSLFDPHSPGHDGAVVVEGDRVTRFAVHLPLSKDFRQLSGVGTRHAAALGLAELTDALCIAVSEERGEISVARDGRLRSLRDPQELGSVLQQFAAAKQPANRRSGLWKQLLRQNWAEKAAAFVLVIALWYLFVPGSRPTVFEYQIPVRVINLPPKYVVEKISPSQVSVKFVGMRRAFYLFGTRNLEVRIDASLAKPGRHAFTISDQNVRYPKDLTLEDMHPSKVRITVKAGPAEPPAENEGTPGRPRQPPA